MIFLFIVLVAADELLSVHIMWRHGARKPYFCNWGCDDEASKYFSQLTPAGMREHYVLGQWLRKRYIDTGFLSNTFNENEIYIESSDTNRTLMSAYSNLQGMYPEGPVVPDVDDNLLLPPINGVETPKDIKNYALPNKIQLIPIHTREQKQDYTMYMYCPILWDDGAHNENTDVFKDINGRVQPLIKQFNEELKQNISTIFHLYQWRDTFISYMYQDLPLPTELTAEMMDKLNKVAGLGFLLEYNQDYYQGSLLTSPFYSGLIDSFDAILNKTSKIKYHAYSAHDSNIYASLYTLNLTSVECYNQTYFEGKSDNPNCITTYPDYASNIIYELYNSSTQGPYVKVLYNGTYVNICNPAAQVCKYHHFKTLMKSVNKDYVKECAIPQPAVQIAEKTPWWAVTFFVLVLALCVCSFSMVIVIYQKKQKVSQDFEKV